MMQGCTIQGQHTKIVFLHTINDKLLHNFKVLFTSPLKIMKYAGLNASKYVHDHSTENHRTLLRESNEGLHKCRDIMMCIVWMTQLLRRELFLVST